MEAITAFFNNTLNCVYGVMLALGFGYSLLLLIGSGSDLFGDVDASVDVDVDVDVDMDAGLDAGANHGTSDVTRISTLAIASGVTAAGAAGIVARALFNINGAASIVIALAGGLVVGALAQVFFIYVLSPTVRTNYDERDLVGISAEVITAIPANNVGQIALVAKGARVTFGARTEDGSAVPRGTTVTIEKIVGGVAYVLPEPHSWL